MPSQQVQTLLKDIMTFACEERAVSNARFAKTGEGEYAHDDVYIGVTVPQIRQLVKQHPPVEIKDIEQLLNNEFHEVRLFALLLMVKAYKKAGKELKNVIFQSYLNNTAFINNWDLVDSSCYHIVGPHVFKKDNQTLMALCRSKNMWERRISVVSTYFHIKNDDYHTTFLLVENMLGEQQDIILKAMGWMVKEISKREPELAMAFLDQHYLKIPRVCLRTAIEKLPADTRKAYLKGER